MPVRARVQPPKPLRLGTALEVIDLQGRASAEAVRDLTVPAVRRALPARSGRLRSATRGRVGRTATGYAVTIAPSKSVRYPGRSGGVSAREVARFVESGTGVYGPQHRAIRRRNGGPFHLPNGWRSTTLRGQRAQHPFERVQTSEDAAVFRVLEAGATILARRMEAAL
jgi:hypothetical protein